MGIVKNIAAIAKGMSVTFSEMFKPTIVENYPDGPGPTRGAMFQDRFRGMHVLQRDENGLEKCVACFLCAAACPSNCIYIEAAENTAEKRVSGAERYAQVYNIDYNRCIFCGYCVEACPTDAITHGHGFELATYNASNLVYRKEQLLAGTPAHEGANAVFSQYEKARLVPNKQSHSRRSISQRCLVILSGGGSPRRLAAVERPLYWQRRRSKKCVITRLRLCPGRGPLTPR